MLRRYWALSSAALVLVAGCAVGPRYHAPAAATTPLRVTTTPAPPNDTRVFFDSLTAARSQTDRAPVAWSKPADVAWLDILRDSALTRLVNSALAQNQNV